MSEICTANFIFVVAGDTKGNTDNAALTRSEGAKESASRRLLVLEKEKTREIKLETVCKQKVNMLN